MQAGPCALFYGHSSRRSSNERVPFLSFVGLRPSRMGGPLSREHKLIAILFLFRLNFSNYRRTPERFSSPSIRTKNSAFTSRFAPPQATPCLF